MIACLLLLGLGVFPAGQAAATGKAEGLEIPAPGTSSRANKRTLGAMIEGIARKHGIDVALVHAVIAAESGYNPSAVSSAGAIGLMQVMPETAADYGVTSADDLFHPETNVVTGVRHLKRLLAKYGNVDHAVAAYNAGEGALERNNLAAPYAETRSYTEQVIGNYRRNKGKLPAGAGDLPISSRVTVIAGTTVRQLAPGLHLAGPDNKFIVFVRKRKK